MILVLIFLGLVLMLASLYFALSHGAQEFRASLGPRGKFIFTLDALCHRGPLKVFRRTTCDAYDLWCGMDDEDFGEERPSRLSYLLAGRKPGQH